MIIKKNTMTPWITTTVLSIVVIVLLVLFFSGNIKIYSDSKTQTFKPVAVEWQQGGDALTSGYIIERKAYSYQETKGFVLHVCDGETLLTLDAELVCLGGNALLVGVYLESGGYSLDQIGYHRSDTINDTIKLWGVAVHPDNGELYIAFGKEDTVSYSAMITNGRPNDYKIPPFYDSRDGFGE